MAKKKTDSTAASDKATEAKETKPKAARKEAAPAPAAANATAPKPAAKAKKTKAPAPVASSTPMIDTGLAAENAAKLIIAGARSNQSTEETTAPKKETSTFKQMKESLSKPHINSGNPLLGGGPTGGNRNKPGFFGGKQVGHNQTFGSGSSRSVPRRTSG